MNLYKWIMNENSNTLIIYKVRKSPVNMRIIELLLCLLIN